MWFDAQSALVELGGGEKPAPHSEAPAQPKLRVAGVASVATPPTCKTEPAIADETLSAAPEAYRHGASPGGRPLTWTGRVVSLDEWRNLSDWERHGAKGRRWCGIARDWTETGKG